MEKSNSQQYLLELNNVTKVFFTRTTLFKRRALKAVDNVSFNLIEEEPETICIVGESGCGKSTLARLILRLIRPTTGEIKYRGRDLWKMTKQEYKTYRREVQAIFQDPFSVYNPFYKISRVLSLPIKKFNLSSSESEVQGKISEALEAVGLSKGVLEKYPHQLSGGERQRVMLARIFLLKPKLVVADEPVSMIDTSLRAEILNKLMDFKKDYGFSLLFITHELSVARHVGDEIIVLYLGEIVEKGRLDDVINEPLHPYTQLLLNCIPIPDPNMRWKKEEVSSIYMDTEYVVSQILAESYSGCKFYNRCAYRMDICKEKKPPSVVLGNNHQVSCHFHVK